MKNYRILFGILFYLLSIPIFASTSPRPVIIDTDLGFDDLLAITYLSQQPSIEIKAITIAATGETACNPGLFELRKMLKRLDKQTIPVYCGRATPLEGTHVFPAKWSPFQIKVNPVLAQTKINAATAITRLLQQSKTSYDIIALGPLTNLGEALQKNPKLVQHIHMMYIMGGAVHVPGNLRIANPKLNDKSEWNFYIDPKAVDIVFKSHAAITLVPLDITNLIKLPPDFYIQLAHINSRAAQTMYANYQSLPSFVASAMQRANWYAWDSLAAVIAIHPAIAVIKIEKARIVTAGPDAGAVIIDAHKGDAIRVSYGLNKTKFTNSLTRAMAQTEACAH